MNAPPPSATDRRRSSKLGSRVAVELLLLTVAFTLVLGAGLSALWTAFARQQLDDRLEELAAEVAAMMGDTNAGALPKAALLPTVIGGPVLILIRDETGAVLQAEPPGAPAPPFDASGGVRTVPAGRLAAMLGGEQVRLLTRPGPWETHVQVGVSTARLASRESLVRLLLVVVMPPLTAGAAVCAWLIARRRLRRLARIAELAAEIGPRQLHRRLDVAGPDDELKQLAEEVNRMLARLETGFAAQDRFMSEVAHELKTPVSVMLVEAQVMARSEPDPAAHARFVASVEDEMRRLTELIESFLTLARARHGEAQVRRVDVDVNDAAAEAGEHCSPLARQRGVRLSASLLDGSETDDPPVVAGDPELLRTMIENLLRNAIFVSARGTTVDLRVARGDGQVQISVRDRGPGVPEGLSSRLFERFVSSNTTGANAKGSGLGLAIARGIAEVHGGRIGFRNVPAAEGGGAEFSVHLPLRAAVLSNGLRASTARVA